MDRQYYVDLIAAALQCKAVIIYGAHLVAKELYQYLADTEENFEFLGFAVTSMEDNPESLVNERVMEITQFLPRKEDVFVLAAMPEKFHEEVADNLERLGFLKYGMIGFRGISYLLGKHLIEWNDKSKGRYQLAESRNEYIWLDLLEKRFSSDDAEMSRHYKFPVITRLSKKENFARLSKFEFVKDYTRVLGVYRNLHELPIKQRGKAEDILDMYMVVSHKDSGIDRKIYPPKWIHTIQAGAILSEKRLAEYQDCSGICISEKNASYAEMTAMYWVWKNAVFSPYIGLCHYRRHFDISDKEVESLSENDIDVVLTTPRLVLNGMREMFEQDTPVKRDVFQNMLSSLYNVWGGESKKAAEIYFEECLYYPNNMFIAKNEIFQNYCNWIFPVLFDMEENDKRNGIIRTNRHIAFSAELLTSFYFSMKKDEYKIALVDYIFL